MILVKFHKLLHNYTNNVVEHTLEVPSYSSLLLGLKQLFPKLLEKEDLFTLVDNDSNIISRIDIMRDTIKQGIEVLYLVPCLIGGGGQGGKQIALGIALIALSVVVPAAAGFAGGFAGGFTGAMQASTLSGLVPAITQGLFGMGVNLVLSGVMQFFTPKAKLDEPTLDSRDQRTNNDLFEGLVNTTDSGQVVSLNYGYNRVGGQLMSGYVKTVDHQRNDVISVTSYV
jgi:predicted phage tail protein|tara:strand:+ start:655 stop:1335 length:681 start_codon:yes stop_codon:yes gene_type:complete